MKTTMNYIVPGLFTAFCTASIGAGYIGEDTKDRNDRINYQVEMKNEANAIRSEIAEWSVNQDSLLKMYSDQHALRIKQYQDELDSMMNGLSLSGKKE